MRYSPWNTWCNIFSPNSCSTSKLAVYWSSKSYFHEWTLGDRMLSCVLNLWKKTFLPHFQGSEVIKQKINYFTIINSGLYSRALQVCGQIKAESKCKEQTSSWTINIYIKCLRNCVQKLFNLLQWSCSLNYSMVPHPKKKMRITRNSWKQK